MNIRRYILLPLSLALSSFGCAPIPHSHYHAPVISGTVTINGSPASKTKIYLGSAIKMTSCKKEPITTTTNEFGEFVIGPIKEFRFVVSFIGDPYELWELCAEYKGEVKQLLQFDSHFTPERLEVKCELSLEEESYIEEVRGLKGLCEAHNS